MGDAYRGNTVIMMLEHGTIKDRLTQHHPENMVVEGTLLQRQKHIPLIGTSHS